MLFLIRIDKIWHNWKEFCRKNSKFDGILDNFWNFHNFFDILKLWPMYICNPISEIWFKKIMEFKQKWQEITATAVKPWQLPSYVLFCEIFFYSPLFWSFFYHYKIKFWDHSESFKSATNKFSTYFLPMWAKNMQNFGKFFTENRWFVEKSPLWTNFSKLLLKSTFFGITQNWFLVVFHWLTH